MNDYETYMYKIVAFLARHGRATFGGLAALTGVSESDVADYCARMHRSGKAIVEYTEGRVASFSTVTMSPEQKEDRWVGEMSRDFARNFPAQARGWV